MLPVLIFRQTIFRGGKDVRLSRPAVSLLS